jgi:hypothetical protein
MEAVMLAAPKNWDKYYHGTDAERALQRHFSYSDRIRYYWPRPGGVWLFGPYRANGFVGRETVQGVEPPGEVVSVEEGSEVIFKLSVCLVVISSDSCVLQRSVHPLNLTVGPWVIGLGETVLDAMPPAGPVEGMAAPACGSAIPVLRGISELDAVVSEHSVDFVRDGFDQFVEKSSCCDCGRLLHQPGESELRGPVDCYE